MSVTVFVRKIMFNYSAFVQVIPSKKKEFLKFSGPVNLYLCYEHKKK